MKQEAMPKIRTHLIQRHFCEFSAEQVREILLNAAFDACGIPDGAAVTVHSTEIEPINFSLSYDLGLPEGHVENGAKEARRVAESVSGTMEPEKSEKAISRPSDEAQRPIATVACDAAHGVEIIRQEEEIEKPAPIFSDDVSPELAAHVVKLPSGDLWGLEDDIELLERSIEGQNRFQIGDAMGRTDQAILKRFDILVGRRGNSPAKFTRDRVLDALRQMRPVNQNSLANGAKA